MGRMEIPVSIALQVMTDWFQGLSRDQIAQKNNVSTGAVSNIVKRFTECFTLNALMLRQIAIKLKKENIGIGDFASSIRLNNYLRRLD